MGYRRLPDRHPLFEKASEADEHLSEAGDLLKEIADAAKRHPTGTDADDEIEELSYDAYHMLVEWRREFFDPLWRTVGGITSMADLMERE